jgi:hypothetical protein
LKSKSQEGHYGTWHTALWSCAHIPNIIDLSRKKQLFDLEVKGPTKVIMVCDTPPYGHAHTHQISLTYLERQKCYSPDNKILLKNIIWPWGQRSRSHEGHYGTRHTVLWSCTHIPNIIDLSRKTKNIMARTRKYYLKNNYLTFMLKVKVQRRSLRYATPPYGHATTYQISLTYLERNNYLTLRSKDKVSRRSLRYVTHRLMVIHPHTKYHWPISRQKCYGPDKKILFKKSLFDLRSKVKVPGRSLWYTTHRLMVMHPYQISLTYLKRNNYLTLRSKVKVQ